MDNPTPPSVVLTHIQLVGDPRKSRFHGEYVGTYIKWPALGVSIMHSMKPLVEVK